MANHPLKSKTTGRKQPMTLEPSNLTYLGIPIATVFFLDQHYEICKDLKYWEKFMDMMVENRFNALTLWNLHPYTFYDQTNKLSRSKPIF